MSNIINKNTDLVSYGAKDFMLKPLPIGKIMQGFKHFFKDKLNKNPDSKATIDDIFSSFNELVGPFNEKFRFKDWRYELNAIFNFEGIPILRVELLAKKENVEMNLLINMNFANEEGLIEYEEWDEEEFTVSTAIDFIYDFFNIANQNIKQWNEITSQTKPLITSEPPTDEVYEYLMDNFYYDVVEREWEYYESKIDMKSYYENFSHFIDEHEYDPAYIFFEALGPGMDYWEFGDVPKFQLDIMVTDLGNHTYGYVIVEAVIHIVGLGISFYINLEEFSKSDDIFYADEVKQMFKHMTDEIWRKVVQWNYSLGGD